MSSPHLNNLIIVGCMLTYSSVIFLGLDSQLSSVTAFPYICTARAWLLMVGFSLAFGAMFSKTWRVHSIFTDVKLNKKVSLSHYILLSRFFYRRTFFCLSSLPFFFLVLYSVRDNRPLHWDLIIWQQFFIRQLDPTARDWIVSVTQFIIQWSITSSGRLVVVFIEHP